MVSPKKEVQGIDIYTIRLGSEPHLEHHGIKGQKWGYRRWQNSDGSLTPAGREHYGKGLAGFAKSRREKGIAKVNKRIEKGNKKLYKAEQKYAPVYSKAASAKKKLAQEQTKYDNISRKIDKAENGFGAKLIGTNDNKIKSLNRKLDKQNTALTKAQDSYDVAQATADQRKAKINQIERYLDLQNAKKRKRVNNYIKRYSEEEYRNIA